MTKTNAFGETIHTPEDQPEDFAAYADKGDGFYSAEVGEDPAFDWCATVSTNGGGELSVHEFPDRESLVDWLEEAGVPPSMIEDYA